MFTDVEISALERQISETESWVKMMTEAQDAAKPYEDPKLKAEEIREKSAILEREVRYLANKAKAYRPKPKTTPKPKKRVNETVIEKPDEEEKPSSEETTSEEKTSPNEEGNGEKQEGEKSNQEDSTESPEVNPTHDPEL